MSRDETYKDLILVGGALVLGYLVLKSQGLIQKEVPTSTEVSPQCPRGSEYLPGFFESCDPNYKEYVDYSILRTKCACQS